MKISLKWSKWRFTKYKINSVTKICFGENLFWLASNAIARPHILLNGIDKNTFFAATWVPILVGSDMELRLVGWPAPNNCTPSMAAGRCRVSQGLGKESNPRGALDPQYTEANYVSTKPSGN